MLSSFFDTIRLAVAGATAGAKPKPGRSVGLGQAEGPLIVAATAALLCAVMPLELSQLAFMVIGALAYAALQPLQPARRSSGSKPSKQTSVASPQLPQSTGTAWRPAVVARGPAAAARARPQTPPTPPRRPGTPARRQELRTPSSAPVAAPTFAGAGWEAEVQELLDQITPGAESDRTVQRLAQVVRQTIRRTIPEVEVMGFASGDLSRGKAFGVAVPDVDVVINVNPNVLVSRLQGRLSQGRTTVTSLDSRRLQKSAIRVCTDKLVTQGGFKFRRSAFRGLEPKVTLLAPASLGIFDEAVPVDFTVNSLTPMYNAALLTECGQIDARARSLILLVKRWSKDRGICHAAKGHLSPYLWTLLTIYYLQTGVPSEGPLLPPVASFQVSSGLMREHAPQQAAAEGPAPGAPEAAGPEAAAGRAPRTPVGELFKGFMVFYNQHFDWRNEAVCVRSGRRAPPDLRLPLHIALHGDRNTAEVGPSIEDPFDAASNLGSCMTAASIGRLREELRRADALCAGGASLTELLEPWIPPEHEAQEAQQGDEEGEGAPDAAAAGA